MCVYVYVKQIMKMEVGKVHNMLGNVKQIMKMEVGKAHTADSSQIMRRKQIYPKGPEGGGIGGIGGIGGGGFVHRMEGNSYRAALPEEHFNGFLPYAKTLGIIGICYVQFY